MYLVGNITFELGILLRKALTQISSARLCSRYRKAGWFHKGLYKLMDLLSKMLKIGLQLVKFLKVYLNVLNFIR